MRFLHVHFQPLLASQFLLTNAAFELVWEVGEVGVANSVLISLEYFIAVLTLQF